MVIQRPRTFGESGTVDFELKSKDALLLDPEAVCKVGGQALPLITSLDLKAEAGREATATIVLTLLRGLDLTLPAAVTLNVELVDYNFELVEVLLEDGGRRIYARERDPNDIKLERAYQAITSGRSSERLATIANVIGNVRLTMISLEKGFDATRAREVEQLLRRYARELVDVADYVADARMGG